MKDIETIEQMFLSQVSNCPFCDNELSMKGESISFLDKKTTTIYEYSCSLQIRVDDEITTGVETTRVTSQQCCSNRTTALETVLSLKQQLKRRKKCL